MEVVRANVMGFCFGVHDAMTVAEHEPEPAQVTIYGELVHNLQVNAALREQGFQLVDEIGRGSEVPATPKVLITAHGISDAERKRFKEAGKRLIDTTCPLVKKAHGAAQRLHREGRFVIVIGKRSHVEVRGITGDLPEHGYDVLQLPDEVKVYPHPKLGVMAQTTTPLQEVERVRTAIELKNPEADIRFIDTVCSPTKQRQEALLRLMDEVDAVVVVGGPESNNTLRLVQLCESKGVRAFRIAEACELQERWFRGCDAVGLTAGTSTPDHIINDVHRALLRIDVVRSLACA